MPERETYSSAVLLGEMVDGMELVPAVERAMNAVAEIIATMEGEEDLFKAHRKIFQRETKKRTLKLSIKTRARSRAAPFLITKKNGEFRWRK